MSEQSEPRTPSGRALLEDFHGEEACASECWHAEAILAIEREAVTVSLEPHEDSTNADIAARMLGSEWHDHPIDDGRGHKFVWRHRHEEGRRESGDASESPSTDHGCQHGMSAHGDDGCIHCPCKVPGFRVGDASESPPTDPDRVCLTIGCNRPAGPAGGRCEIHHVGAGDASESGQPSEAGS